MQKNYDIIVVGGGMVGSLFACALERTDLSIALIESGETTPSFSHQMPYALRVSAINIASQLALQATGVWPGVLARRACPYKKLLVWDEGNPGGAQFNCAHIGRPELGHIVENHVLVAALHERLQACDNIDLLLNTRLTDLKHDRQSNTLITECGKTLSATLVVGADGRNSNIRTLSGIASNSMQYHDQHALVATVATALPQQDITWQRFRTTGAEAFLPLVGNRASIVWYHTPERTKELQAIDDAQFIAQLQQTFPRRLGAIESVIARATFPLYHHNARHYVQPGLALLGDAAHSFHPLAGQGVNLGLADAIALAQVIIDSGGKEIGSLAQLRQYERWRKSEAQLMHLVTDGCYRAFGSPTSALAIARNCALKAVDRFSPLNRLCMRLACGIIDDAPPLIREGLAATSGRQEPC